jgi:hypothetical protein
MSGPPRRYFVVHGRGGRILALAPLEAPEPRDGVAIGWRPVPGRGQLVNEVELTEEHLQLGPQELLERFRVRVNKRKGARLEVAARVRRSKRTPAR